MINLLFVVENSSALKSHWAYLTSKKINVLISENYNEAWEITQKNKISIIVGEIQVGDKEIGEFIIELSEINQKPLFFAITDEHTTYQSIYALNSGVQNVIHTNNSPKLVYAQIKALFKFINKSSLIEHKDLQINHESYTVIYKNKEVNLSARELRILSLISSKNGAICPREEIIQECWSEKINNPRIIDVYIRKIRSKTSDDIIKSVHGLGYRLNSSLLQ
tara:strand:+ start:85 stop:747 length:663 start_codon:yes stop_codon:yes gene_type:complete